MFIDRWPEGMTIKRQNDLYYFEIYVARHYLHFDTPDHKDKVCRITVDIIEAFIRTIGNLIDKTDDILHWVQKQPLVRPEDVDKLIESSRNVNEASVTYLAWCGAALLLNTQLFYEFMLTSSLLSDIGKNSPYSSLVFCSEYLP